MHVSLLTIDIGLARLAGDSWFSNSSCGHGTGLSRSQLEGQLDRSTDMPIHRLLLTARTHPSNRRIQKFLHSRPWNIEHARPCSSVGLSYLGSPAALLLDFSRYTLVYPWSCRFSDAITMPFDLLDFFVEVAMLIDN